MARNIIQGKVKSLTEEGRGIVPCKGGNLYVPYVIPGEMVKVEVTETRTGKRSSLVGVTAPSSDRVKPPCPYFYECGGCQLQHMNYQAQLNFKSDYLNNLLSPFGKIEGIVGMEDPFRYRNKVIATFGYDKGNKPISGIYSESSHRLVPVDVCLIEDSSAREIVATVKKLASEFKIRIYDEDRQRGILRHVVIRKGWKTSAIMVTLVVASLDFPSRANFIKALAGRHPEIGTVVLNLNKRKTSIVLGQEEKVAYGRGHIEDELLGLRFNISSRSFYQVNSQQTEKLYELAREYADLKGKELVVDAYCGIGTIGMVLAATSGQVIGVESNKDAVKDARINARKNGIENISFINGDASSYLKELAEEGRKVDVVVMDPPREGSDEVFLSSVLSLKPEQIVYVSCGPYTLARDLEFLTATGEYEVRRMSGVDMFPQTYHVETVVLLQKK